MNERCTCDAIQRADKRRHFRECPLRAPLTPDPAIDKRTAIVAAFGDLGFEYASDPDPISDDEIREYRSADNVHRPSREPGYRHGLVVHRLTDAWAMQRAEIIALRERVAELEAAIRAAERCSCGDCDWCRMFGAAKAGG